MRTYHEIKEMISQLPMQMSWTTSEGKDGFSEPPKFNFPKDVTDLEKIVALIMAYNAIEVAPKYKTIEKQLGIKRKAAENIIAKLKNMDIVVTVTTFDEETGLMRGKGFMVNDSWLVPLNLE